MSNIVLDEIDFHVTTNCNLNCNFCSVRANEHSKINLPLNLIKNFIDEAVDLGLKKFHITGGEPALRDDLEEIVQYVTKYDVDVRLITNGTLLNKDRLLKLQDAGLNSIMVSIDGLERNHNAMRGNNNAWQKAISCVKTASDLGMTTRIAATAFSSNLQDIFPLMQLADDLGTNIFSIFLGSPLGRGLNCKELIINPEDWRKFIEYLGMQIKQGYLGKNMEVIVEQGFHWHDTDYWDHDKLLGRGTGCFTLSKNFDYLIVRSDGSLYPCVFFLLHDEYSIGNIKDTNLYSILKKSQTKNHYANLAELPKDCTACQLADLCRGGCRGYSFLYSSSWHNPDPRCLKDKKGFYPLCPIAKLNMRTNKIGGSSEQALE